MSDEHKTCIYCRTQDQTGFEGVEHVIPASFGKFSAETPTLKCVCDDCNSFFGRGMDQNLARQTIEGLSRYAHGKYSSEDRPQSKVTLTLREEPGIEYFAGFRVIVNPTNGSIDIPPQFHIKNLKTNENETYILYEIEGLKLPEDIYGKQPGADGEKGTWDCKAFAMSKEGHDAVVEALQRNGINFRPGTRIPPPDIAPPAEGEKPSRLVEMDSEVDDLHKRAIAKILMNFMAHYLGCDEALRPRWDFLRNYVRHGEGKIRARLSPHPFWNGQETETRTFADDSINVRLENLGSHIIGVIQFYGHQSYEFILAENDALPSVYEIAYRFTPGQAPYRGEKRAVGVA